MTEFAPRLLFVPVSGAFGMGEYARSLAIAQAAKERWPGASLHFVLSRAAPYAATVPYPTTLLAASPTFHSAAVIDVIHTWRPDVVIFDNAGRTAQLRAAKRSGAAVVFISARRRQRRKAFRLRWMRVIDEHWIAYPAFIAGALNFVERFRLALMRRPTVRHLDVIFSTEAPRDSLLARLGCLADRYLLVVPGGGTGHPGASDAVAEFLRASRGLAEKGIDTVFVGYAAAAGESAVARAGSARDGAGALDGPATRDAASSRATVTERASRLRLAGRLPQAELVELMRGARLIIVNGGSTLLQALACGKSCIAVPIAADQPARIQRCERVGAVVGAALDADAMLRTAFELWGDEQGLASLATRAAELELADGIEVAVGALAGLLAARPRTRTSAATDF